MMSSEERDLSCVCEHCSAGPGFTLAEGFHMRCEPPVGRLGDCVGYWAGKLNGESGRMNCLFVVSRRLAGWLSHSLTGRAKREFQCDAGLRFFWDK